jgi:DNA modification methylase
MTSPATLRNFGLDWDSLRPVTYIKSSENMAEVGEATVDLVVTSPPYGSIKDYGIAGQIGFADSFEDYFARLKRVWSECWRVLKAGGRLVVNVGDQYLRKTEHERYRIVPIGAQITLDCIQIGFDYLGDVIWQKVSTTNTTGGCSLMGSLFYPNNGLFTFDYEHLLIFKKVGATVSNAPPEMREYSKIPLDEWKRWFTGHWRFPGVVQKEHIAMFPEELPHRIIRMFSAVGGMVLDPFVGSGTTLKVAQSLLRRSIGYEINPSFEPIIKQKISEAQPNLFSDYQLLLNSILSSDQYTIDLGFSRQKGVTCLQDQVGGVRLVLDYLFNDTLDPVEEQSLLEKKMEENPFQSYQKGLKDWAAVDRYIVLVNPSFKIPVQIPPSSRPYGAVAFGDVLAHAGNPDYLRRIFSQPGNKNDPPKIPLGVFP